MSAEPLDPDATLETDMEALLEVLRQWPDEQDTPIETAPSPL